MDRPEAGWYPDPEHPGRARYFDGVNWTNEVRDHAPSDSAGGFPAAEPSRAGTVPTGDDATAPLPAAAAARDGDAPGAPSGEGLAGGAPRQPTESRATVLAVSVALMVLVLGGSLFFGGFFGDDGDDAALEGDDADEPAIDPSLDDEEDPAADDLADDGEAEGGDAGSPGEDGDAADPAPTDDDGEPEGGEPEAAGPQPPDVSDIDPYELVIDTDATYVATIETSEGDVVVELDAAAAPVTTNNLVRLARAGFYDGVIFHRVIEGFVIQGGDPTGTGSGGPGYRFEDELTAARELVDAEGGYPRGTLAMANAGPDTNGSQFFIVHGDLVELPPAYTVFGQVTDGMDVVDAIATTPTGAADRPTSDVTIRTIEITGP